MNMTNGILPAAVAAFGGAIMIAGTQPAHAQRTFGEDVAFLAKQTDVVVLQDESGKARVALAPAYQGRVMTSTTGGDAGPSYGWLNYAVIEEGIRPEADRKGKLQDHIHVFGGEERFWLGPEGGQFSIFFKPGDPFEFAVWKTPAPIDTEPYRLADKSASSAKFTHEFALTNWSRAILKCGVERSVRLVPRGEVASALGAPVPEGVACVAYETDNRLTNRGDKAWTRESGMLSIWLLGMYKPAPATTVVIPFKAGAEAELGPKVNDAYFGKVPADYLQVRDRVLFFKGDGTRRGKIGISPKRSKGLAGSYDAASKTLNLVTCTLPERHPGYVNSMWELQKEPFAGDQLNAYNDGAPEPGKPPLGPFYELETSSPAADLAPGAQIRHVQRTIHLQGPDAALDPIARAVLGVGLDEIRTSFRPGG